MTDTSRARSGATVEERLTLLLASTDQRRQAERDRLKDMVAQAEPATLSATLNGYRLLQLGIARLGEIGATELAQALTAANVDRLRLTKIRSFAQEAFVEVLSSLLEEHDVPAVPLKGVMLARRVYSDRAMQESGDLDILVLPEQLDSAVQLVRERFGFAMPKDLVDRDGRPLLHFRLEHAQGAFPVELHWRIHWYETRSGPTMVRRAIQEGGTRRLALVDEFASLLLFYARDGFTGIRQLSMIASWWDRYGNDLPPAEMLAFTDDFPELTPALAQSADLAADLVGIPRPPWSLHGGGVRRRRSARARRLANWRIPQSYKQTIAEIALVDLLLAPPDAGWQSLRRQVFISREQVAHQRPQPERSEWRLVAAQVRHIASLAVRFAVAFAMTRKARGGRRSHAGAA